MQRNMDCLIQEVYNEKLYYSKLIITSILPLAALLLCAFSWFLLSLFKKTPLFQEKLLNSLVMIIFLLHTTITKTEFSMFACQELKSGELWLLHDLQQRCWDHNHLRYIWSVGLPSILLWVIALPLACFSVIMRKRLVLSKLEMQIMFGFLYKGYVRKRFYWEFVILYRKILLVSALVFLASVSAAVQAQTVLLVLLISVIYQIHISPFAVNAMNTLEIKSIFVSLITIYCGLYYESSAIGSIYVGKSVKISLFLLILIANGYFLGSWVAKILPALIESCKYAFNGLKNRYRAESVAPTPAGDQSDLIDSISLSHSRSHHSAFYPPFNTSLASPEPSIIPAEAQQPSL